MAFRLRQQEPVAHGLRRLVAKQLKAAADQLARSNGLKDEAVHQARKSIKKVRAIVHLIEEDHGGHLGDSKKRLRAVNRRLSIVRDADATTEALEKIRRKNPHLLSEHTFARVGRTLSSHKDTVMRAAGRDHSRAKTVTAVRALQKTAKRWRTRHQGFGALAAGIRATHRRGCKAMERAVKRQRAADFHAWRKEIKTLWYELRLLEACSADIRKDIRTLDRAETMLGDEHNTFVLCEHLFGDRASRPAADLEALRGAAERYQRDLRRRVTASARRIYTATPNEYVRRIKSAWKRWHRRGPAHSRKPRSAAA